MNKSLASLITIAAFVSSCSSVVKSERGQSEPTAPAPLGTVGGASELMPEDSPPPTKPVSRTQKSELTTAIESQNTRSIKKAALAVLESNPQHLEALNALAMAHFKDGNPGLAKMMLQRALQVEKRAGIYNNLGVIYLTEKKDKEAIDAFREALKLDSNNDEAAANAGAIYVQNRDYKKALTVLQMAYDKGNRELSTIHNYAVALTANGDARRAESFYETVIQKTPNSTEALTNYAIYLIDHKKDYKKGMEMINKLRFIGVPSQVRDEIRRLEEKANGEMNKG